MEKKQSSIDFLIEQIEIILKLNDIKLNAGYTIHTISPIIEKLKAMHKEEIMGAIKVGYDMATPSEPYYNETFGETKN